MVSINVGNFVTVGLMALIFIVAARFIAAKIGMTSPV